MDYKKQTEDIEKAIKNYEKHSNKVVEKGDLSVQGAAKNIYNRKNILDKLNDDLQNAGRSKYDKLVHDK
jgi:hypothetical protein